MRLTFDRGTLLLDGDGDPSSLPGVLWDPRVRRWRAPAHRYRDLLDALGPSARDQVLDAPAAPARAVPELRPYQRDALVAWEHAGRRGVVALPTGAGKTRVAAAAIAACGVSALCLVPTRALLAQWVEALGGCGQLGDGVRHVEPVTVATFASARVHAERIGNRFALLVVDEAHHFGGGGHDEALEMIAAPSRLGLTATPPLEPDRLQGLERVLGPVVFRRGVDDLAGTWLAPFELVRVTVDLDPDERRAWAHHMGRFRPVCQHFFRLDPRAGWPEFVAAAQRSVQGRQALASFRIARELVAFPRQKRHRLGQLLDEHRDRQVLVFTRDNATAYAVAREHLVHPLTCDVGRAERAQVLERFARRELGVLVSARVLNEGVDVPEADVAILVGGSGSSREYVQRVGRVLRPSHDKRARVYELVVRDTHEPRQAARGRGHLASP
jgi:superfamily II DNA or RNA helicase